MEINKSEHNSVMLKELIQNLDVKQNEWYLDCTFGRGGHSLAVLQEGGCVIAIDRDLTNKKYAEELENQYRGKFKFYNIKFSEIESILESYNFAGIYYDFGVSSMQIDQAERGFSFYKEGPLDMSMGLNKKTAKDIVNSFKEEDLANLIYKYGNERFSRKIAKAIVKLRSIEPISTTKELADCIRTCVKSYNDEIHPATRTFQAIRIFVNNELEEIETSLKLAVEKAKSGCKIITISFHSLEDVIVKTIFNDSSKEFKNMGFNRYDPRVQDNIIETKKLISLPFKKPLTPSFEEISLNPRARSAKMRIAIKD